MEAGFNNVNFFSIPKEIRVYALSFLNEKELAVASAVSKEFKNDSEDNVIWEEKAKKRNVTLVDPQNAKESMANTVNEMIKMNQIVREIFPEIPEHKNPFEQHQANIDYIVGPAENVIFLRDKQEHINKSLDVLSKEIEAGSLERVKALCCNGVNPHIYILQDAINDNKVEIVKFLMEKFGQEYEKEINEKERKLNEITNNIELMIIGRLFKAVKSILTNAIKMISKENSESSQN
jgi:hypothetical protein